MDRVRHFEGLDPIVKLPAVLRERISENHSHHRSMWRDGPVTTLGGHDSFRHYFTLFTEFFASFHHCTYALSVPVAILRRGRYPSAGDSCCTFKQHYSEGTYHGRLLGHEASKTFFQRGNPLRGYSPCFNCTLPGFENCERVFREHREPKQAMSSAYNNQHSATRCGVAHRSAGSSGEAS